MRVSGARRAPPTPNERTPPSGNYPMPSKRSVVNGYIQYTEADLERIAAIKAEVFARVKAARANEKPDPSAFGIRLPDGYLLRFSG